MVKPAARNCPKRPLLFFRARLRPSPQRSRHCRNRLEKLSGIDLAVFLGRHIDFSIDQANIHFLERQTGVRGVASPRRLKVSSHAFDAHFDVLDCARETGTNTEPSKNSNASFLVFIVPPFI